MQIHVGTAQTPAKVVSFHQGPLAVLGAERSSAGRGAACTTPPIPDGGAAAPSG